MSIHSHSRSSSLEPWRSVKTAKEYRAMAEECAKWAREAHDDDVSAPLLQLAQRWLDAAGKLDGLPAGQVAPSLERPMFRKEPLVPILASKRADF